MVAFMGRLVVVGLWVRHAMIPMTPGFVPAERLDFSCISPKKPMKPYEQSVFRFGGFMLVPSERLLLCEGRPLPLTGKAFDLLVALVRHAGHLMTKDELLQAVWPSVVVEEVNLSVNISVLRKVLGVAPTGDWIETVPRQGYRFHPAVEAGDVATTAALAPLAEEPLTGHPARDAGAAPRLTRRNLAWLLGGAATAAVGFIAGARWLGQTPPAAYASVAVLPFAVDDAANAYLADGVAEGLIHGLTPWPGLRVTPRASAFRFRDALADPLSAGRALDAAAVVTGSLTRSGETVRLQVEVVDVARKAQVWSTVYEVALADLPLLEGRAMQDLATALRVAGVGAAPAGPAVPATKHPEAYQAYLQGRYLWNQRSEASLQEAIVRFRRAIELDPGFASAHAGLADAHTTLGYLGHVAPAASFAVGRPHALQALALDPSLAQAHASLAYIKFYFDWDWAGARDEFGRALELNAGDPVSHQWYAVYLLASGQPDRALQEVQTAHRLDPLSLAINTDIGFTITTAAATTKRFGSCKQSSA
jgi:DNA-binding winged helix-turn-helix (wHTH) protein/TolB-like protein